MHELSNQEILVQDRIDRGQEITPDNHTRAAEKDAALKRTEKITQEELKRILQYNPETGIFTYRMKPNFRIRVGSVAGSPNSTGYIQIKIGHVLHKAHRLAWLYVYGVHPKGEIDHRNHVKDDNRISNLRDGTKSQNQGNRVTAQASSKTGIIGVWWNKWSKRWTSSITVNRKRKHLGYFSTQEEAAAAYIAAKRGSHDFCTL